MEQAKIGDDSKVFVSKARRKHGAEKFLQAAEKTALLLVPLTLLQGQMIILQGPMNLAKEDKKSTKRCKGGRKKVEVLHQKILQDLDLSPLPESSTRVLYPSLISTVRGKIDGCITTNQSSEV